MSSPNASTLPISIGFPGVSPSSRSSSLSSTSSSDSTWDAYSFTSTSNANSLVCAFPSWPSRRCLSPTLIAQRDTMSYNKSYSSQLDVPNSYISDFDLFPEDLEDESEVPRLEEAPAPPRPAPSFPLAPLFASERPRNKKRRSSRKQTRPAQAMTPIAESPLASPE
jgi:hypothetical protein